MSLSDSYGLRRVRLRCLSPNCIGLLNAGFGGLGVLRNPGYWGGVKKALSHTFSEAVVDPVCQRYQRLMVFSQFLRGQFILDRVKQPLVESVDRWKSFDECLCIPPTLGGEGVRNSMAKSVTGLAPWQMLNSRLAASLPPTR